MEQERKAAELAAEDTDDEEHPEDEDVTALDWEENIEKERQRIRAEAAAGASKEVGKLRLGACWACISGMTSTSEHRCIFIVRCT